MDSHHYVICDYCPGEKADWSVIVGPDGEVERVECRHCGGTGWERFQEANHV